MDRKGIILVNLSKGKSGEDNAALLGALVLTRLQLAALGRADVLEATRVPMAVYIDEFPSLVTESFAGMLSESRKYGLQLVMAHQYLQQLPASLRAAVLGNVGTSISFRLGPEDAQALRIHFGLTYSVDDFTELPAYDTYLRLSIGGKTSAPFSATTLPPSHRLLQHRDKVVDQSRLRHASRLAAVKRSITRWLSTGAIVV